MKFAENREYSKDALLHVDKSIHQTTSWNDLVDALSVYAYIVKFQYDVVIEEKCKRDNGSEGSLKRTLRLDKGQQETIQLTKRQ